MKKRKGRKKNVVLTEAISKNIRELRKKNHLTQDDFAEKINASMFTVVAWEKGKSMPSLELLVQICNTFDCDLDWLTGRMPGTTHEDSFVMKYTGLTEENIRFLQDLNEEQLDIIEYWLSKDSGFSAVLQGIIDSRKMIPAIRHVDIDLDIDMCGYRLSQHDHEETVVSLRTGEEEHYTVPASSPEELKERRKNLKSKIETLGGFLYLQGEMLKKTRADFENILRALVPTESIMKTLDHQKLLDELREE